MIYKWLFGKFTMFGLICSLKCEILTRLRVSYWSKIVLMGN